MQHLESALRQMRFKACEGEGELPSACVRAHAYTCAHVCAYACVRMCGANTRGFCIPGIQILTLHPPELCNFAQVI